MAALAQKLSHLNLHARLSLKISGAPAIFPFQKNLKAPGKVFRNQRYHVFTL